MSDTAQSSAVALLKTPISSSKQSVTSTPRFNNETSPGDSFSRELTRASDRAEVKRYESARSESDKIDQGGQGQTDRARRSRNADRTEQSHSGTSQREEAQQSGISSSKESASHATKTDQAVEEYGKSGTAVDNSESENTEIADAPARAPEAQDASVLASTNTQSSPDTPLVSESNAESELSDIKAEGELSDFVANKSSAIDAVALNSAESASTELSGQLQTANPTGQDNVAGISDASSEISTSVTNGVAGKRAVLPGEQLSPAELASRQAGLVGQSVMRQGNAASSVQDANLTAGTADEIDLLRGTGSGASTDAANLIKTPQAGDSATQQAINSSQQLSSPSRESRAASIQGLAEKMASDDDLEVADLKAAAELDAKLAVRKSEQQVIQTNLAHAQIQAQLQARQQATQAPVNSAINTVAGDIAESGNPSVDNMFLSSSGGIVTAPVLQRADAGSTQNITAPLNMPILQGDGEKAMAGNIRWMVNEGVKNAVIHVTPSGMGPISVRVGKEKDHIKVSIVALQGSTREALDSMLPRLREQLAAQGHDSVSVDISDGRTGQSDRGYEQQGSTERQAMENQSRSSSGLTDSAQEDLMSERPVEGIARSTQELITVDSNGQVRSRYDAYV